MDSAKKFWFPWYNGLSSPMKSCFPISAFWITKFQNSLENGETFIAQQQT